MLYSSIQHRTFFIPTTMQYTRFLLILCLLPLSIYAQDNKTVCLPKGTNISISITETLNSQRYNNISSAIVSGDVWDTNGESILIKQGTPVTLQIKSVRATTFGDEGSIEIQPISTLAYNGRLITFDGEQTVKFNGNEAAIFSSQKKVTVPAGTTFIATISNDYCFQIQ